MQKRQKDAGQYSRGKQVGDTFLGDDRVNHHDNGRRYKNAEGAGRGDGAGCDPDVVAIALHFRHGNPRDRRRGGERRAGYRTKTRAGPDTGDGQRTTQAREHGVHGFKQLACEICLGGDNAHQDKQRHDGKGIIARDVERRRAQGDEGGGPSFNGDVAEKADEAEGDADRHPHRTRTTRAISPSAPMISLLNATLQHICRCRVCPDVVC